ncbi:hypothetical protein PanWU01x14_167850 [Parasponia andersonii]|uniref:Uncharacterized protein n=1 Tax=Parasponia andersonii TaxID=3476 RepID=A0A2P5CAU0_PARAD|nr:hypothetical protein PanWU01x14_167850 [Parasponia andersonii]
MFASLGTKKWSLHILETNPCLFMRFLKFSYIYFCTVNPNPVARKVAINGNTKTTSKNPRNDHTSPTHFAVAVPDTVVGPPTLEFDAISNNFRFKENIAWPIQGSLQDEQRNMDSKENMKILGAVQITLQMFPQAPTTVP